MRRVAAVVLVAACGGDKEPSRGADVPALLAEARALAESTWPDATLGGIRVGNELDFETRKEVHAVRLSIEFDSDPVDPSAKSAAIVCSPGCVIHRAKVDGIVYGWPACDWTRALAAAREGGLEAAAPIATFGNWSRGPVWQFRAHAKDPGSIEVDGTTCAVR